MKKILFRKLAEKDLKEFDKKLKEKIIRKIVYIAEFPLSGKFLQGKFKGSLSFRVWPYRIIYQIHGNEILIERISHRQGVYKN